MKSKFLCLFLLFYSGAANAQQNLATQSWVVPFGLHNHFMIIVEGSIGDLGPLNFLVDTGTNPTVVDQRVTRKLHLNGYKSKLPVVSGQVDTSELLVPDITVGPVTRTAVRVAVQDLSPLEKETGVRIDAMVGLDVLGFQSFRIDYLAQTVTFGRTSADAAPSANFTVEPPFITVEMKMNRQPLRLLVDTGSPELVLFETHLADSLRNLPSVRRVSRNLNGELALREVQLSETELGSSSLGARRAYVASNADRNIGFDGLLGVSALRVRQISFDFERRRFTWQVQDSWSTTLTEADPGNCTIAGAQAAMSQSLLRASDSCSSRMPRRRSAQ